MTGPKRNINRRIRERINNRKRRFPQTLSRYFSTAAIAESVASLKGAEATERMIHVFNLIVQFPVLLLTAEHAWGNFH